MAVVISPFAGVGTQFFDSNGDPLSGGKIYTYLAGTTTPLATYTSSAGTTPLANPIILDAAGRVATGEIWLSDGFMYKFVLKDANDVTIATYDNVPGINASYVNYTISQEIQTATAGQTVFTLTTMQYQPGTNNLSVFVDGINQYGPGAQYAYTETSPSVVTFNTGLNLGEEVKFTTAQLNSSSAADSTQISYTAPYSTAVATNVNAKLGQYVSVKDFGAVGNGTVDDTAAIQAAIDAVKTSYGAAVYFPPGRYKITSSIKVPTKTISLYGSGADTSIIEALSCDGIEITVPSTDRDTQFFQDFSLIGAPGSTANWTAITSTLPSGGTSGTDSRDGLHFLRLKLYNWNKGFVISDTWEWSIQLCKIQKVTNPIELKTYSMVGRILNNFMVFEDGDSFGGTADAYAINLLGPVTEGILIQNNQFFGFKRALNADSNSNNVYITFTQNDVSSTEYGVYVGLINSLFYCAGNYFELKTDNSIGVYITAQSTEVNWQNVIHANFFIRGTGSNTIGIKAGTTGTQYAWRNDIQFNHFFGMNGYDIALYGGAGKTNIANNRCSSTGTTASIYVESVAASGAPVTISQNWCVKGIQLADASDLTDGQILLNQNTENDTYQAWRQTAAPTTGTWRLGDIVWNSDPASSEYVGWVCTVAGTPGTWRGFGQIA